MSKLSDNSVSGGFGAVTKKKTVLVIDDCPFIRELAGDALSSAGYDVVLMEDGMCSDKYFSRVKFDAAFVDLNMPGLSGQEIIRKLRSLPQGKNAPIFVITASQEFSDIRECYDEHAATLVLSKPVNWDLAIEKLQQEILSCAA